MNPTEACQDIWITGAQPVKALKGSYAFMQVAVFECPLGLLSDAQQSAV